MAFSPVAPMSFSHFIRSWIRSVAVVRASAIQSFRRTMLLAPVPLFRDSVCEPGAQGAKRYFSKHRQPDHVANQLVGVGRREVALLLPCQRGEHAAHHC